MTSTPITLHVTALDDAPDWTQRSSSPAGSTMPGSYRVQEPSALGVYCCAIRPTVEPEIKEYPTKPGDVYLLCSDGLCDMVDDEDMGMTLQALGGNLKLAAQQLVQMANDNGGKDNVSVILVRVLKDYPAKAGLFGWLK